MTAVAIRVFVIVSIISGLDCVKWAKRHQKVKATDQRITESSAGRWPAAGGIPFHRRCKGDKVLSKKMNRPKCQAAALAANRTYFSYNGKTKRCAVTPATTKNMDECQPLQKKQLRWIVFKQSFSFGSQNKKLKKKSNNKKKTKKKKKQVLWPRAAGIDHNRRCEGDTVTKLENRAKCQGRAKTENRIYYSWKQKTKECAVTPAATTNKDQCEQRPQKQSGFRVFKQLWPRAEGVPSNRRCKGDTVIKKKMHRPECEARAEAENSTYYSYRFNGKMCAVTPATANRDECELQPIKQLKWYVFKQPAVHNLTVPVASPPQAVQKLPVPVASPPQAVQNLTVPVASPPQAVQKLPLPVASTPQTDLNLPVPVASTGQAVQNLTVPVASPPQAVKNLTVPVASPPQAVQKLPVPAASTPQTDYNLPVPVASTGQATSQAANLPATATGDPHLSNIRGEKFDVHDGLHRLVHFPRGASDSDALLMIDANASMMPGEVSCYNCFFQSARISGKWLGDDILLEHDEAPMGTKKFVVGMKGKLYEWSDLATEATKLQFSGTEPIKLSTRVRDASLDTPGGKDVEFRIGHEQPVLVQVWASRGSNELTDHQKVQYLNLEVKNLPENTGGLLGLDAYSRPAGSKCGLTQEERRGIVSLSDLARPADAKISMLQFRISAHARGHK